MAVFFLGFRIKCLGFRIKGLGFGGAFKWDHNFLVKAAFSAELLFRRSMQSNMTKPPNIEKASLFRLPK